MNKKAVRMIWERNIARIIELHDRKEIDDIVAARYIGDAWREYVNYINRLED